MPKFLNTVNPEGMEAMEPPMQRMIYSHLEDEVIELLSATEAVPDWFLSKWYKDPSILLGTCYTELALKHNKVLNALTELRNAVRELSATPVEQIREATELQYNYYKEKESNEANN